MQKIAILYDASQAVLSTFELDEVLQQILIIARDYFRLPNVSILLLDKETNELYVRSQIGWDQKSDGVRVPIGTGLIGTAAKEKRPVYVPDVTKDPRYLPCSKKTASELAIPLMVRDEVVGVLDCQSENVDHFDSETIDLLTLFSTQASMALQNARLYSLERRRASQLEAINAIAQQTTAVLDAKELLSKVCMLIQNAFYVDRVKQLAYLDGLTGIFNRRFFELRIAEELERARRFNTGMAVVMVDIDQFKRLNDEFGHLLGDEVLRQVSSIFHQQLRKIDVVCRYGGEEFAILLAQTNQQHALGVAEKLRRMVEAWQFPGVPRAVTISVGAATSPDHGTTRDELVKAADLGLYAAKQAGRNRVCMATERQSSAAQVAGK